MSFRSKKILKPPPTIPQTAPRITVASIDPPVSQLVKNALKTPDNNLSNTGALLTLSGAKTGRSPKDKRIVLDDNTKNIWWGSVNIPMTPKLFEFYKFKAMALIHNYEINGYAGWDTKNNVKVKLYTNLPYHALFMKNLLINPTDIPSQGQTSHEFIIYDAGELDLPECLPPLKDKNLTKTLVAINFTTMEAVIFGTKYAGEIKKLILTLIMYLMPLKGYLPLHSSANISAGYQNHEKIVDLLDLDLNTGSRDLTLFFGLSGSGKCLGKDTPVLMYDGTIKLVQDIKVGEQIMGDDSKSRNILSTCTGREQLYEISSSGKRATTKSTKYIVNESHILSLKANPEHLNMYKTDGDIIDISVKDYLTVLPKSYVNKGDGSNSLLCGYRVPILFNKKPIPFDPYMLGYWLGDGTSAKPDITTIEKEVIEYFEQNLTKYQLELKQIHEKDKSRDISYRIISSGDNYKQKGCNTFINILRKYNLFNNKHIPMNYKCNDRKVQLAILAGILDSDGYYDKKGKIYDIVLKSEKLFDDVIFLARSLGYSAYKSPCKKTCTNSKNGPVIGDYFRTTISGDNLSEIPCIVPRKQAENRIMNKSVLKYGITVKKLDVGDYYGFEIDGNKRFLLGDFTVTHNTSLSADSKRMLIGDDEHVWSNTGVFNIEGGCYAKCINLSQQSEPEIFNAIKYGAVIENVIYDKNFVPDYTSDKITENTRCAYPLSHIQNALIPAITTNHPTNIVLLVCDSFGVFPPVAKLSYEQAVYFFISGYTAKIAGTEQGIKSPEAVFSACFGEPFLVWQPKRYGDLLKEKLEKHKPNVWLLNTGWIKGGYGKGERISIKYSKTILNKIHDGSLEKEETFIFPKFEFSVPVRCDEINDDIFNPRELWTDKDKYDKQLDSLYEMFNKNYNDKLAGTSKTTIG